MRWLPFQLNPDIPESGMSRREYVERKFGPRGNANYARVAAIGKEVGIEFAFDRIQVQPNTVDAHRLLHYADVQSRQDETAEALFHAYFIEGENLADRNTLADIGARAGLDRAAVAEYLASDAGRELIQTADIEARSAGIEGVPFFIFNRKVGVPGAHEPETLLQAILQSLQDEPAAAP